MSWLPGFFSPAAAWLFLLLIPLIAFYFLKLKRPRLTIPSLVLWQQVLNDQRVNSPFQKFKRNLLLLFQLLLLILLILAAMQPFFSGDRERAMRLPVLIDTSASMGSLDGPGGVSRLEATKLHIREMIDQMLPDQQMCLITVNNTARQETVFTSNKRLLLEGLEGISVADVPGTLEDGLRMAQAVRRGEPFDELIFYSDGNFPQQALVDLPFQIDFRKVEPGGANIGITGCTARRADSQFWDVFVELRASADEPSSGTLTISSGEGNDEIIVASKIVSVRAESPQRYVFRIDGRTASGLLRISLEPEAFDALKSDNFAFLQLDQSRPLRVFAPANLYAVRHALRSIPDLELYPDGSESGTVPTEVAGNFDLVISPRPDDAEIPASLTCIFGAVPEEVSGLISVEEENSQIIDWRRASPLFDHVNLREVDLLDRPSYVPEADATALAERGYRVLIDGERGPLALELEEPGRKSVWFLFDPSRSLLPYRVAFPVMVNNLVNEALRLSGLAESKANPTGILGSANVSPNATVTVVAPGGSTSSVTADETGRVSGISAPQAGMYRLTTGGHLQILGASLVSPKETSLKGVPEIRFNEFSVAASEDAAKSDRPFWRYLAIGALVLLFIEWWFFQKRPFSLAAPSERPSRPRRLSSAR